MGWYRHRHLQFKSDGGCPLKLHVYTYSAVYTYKGRGAGHTYSTVYTYTVSMHSTVHVYTVSMHSTVHTWSTVSMHSSVLIHSAGHTYSTLAVAVISIQ